MPDRGVSKLERKMKVEEGEERRLSEVSLSLDGQKILFLFENEDGYAIARRRLPGDDGSPVVSVQIADHRQAVTVLQSSGQNYSLPWDSIRHYASGGRQKTPLLGRRLIDLRKRNGLTQAALAKAADLSRMQLSRLEKGKSSPTLETLLSLSRVLKTLPRDLFG